MIRQIVRAVDLSKIGPIDDNPVAKKYINNEAFCEAWDFCRNILNILRGEELNNTINIEADEATRNSAATSDRITTETVSVVSAIPIEQCAPSKVSEMH